MTEYTVDGSTVLRQSWNNGSDSYTADYLYDENGNPFGFIYRKNGGTASYYFYETNIFGDIAAVYNSNGSKIVSFTYDAWGNVTQTISNTTVCTDDFIKATLFRYRGYIYDSETNLYYLQSRYYDPEVGRFINADSALYHNMLGYNLFVYTYNNPIGYVDYTGKSVTAALATWVSTAWGLTLVDGPLPIGDIIYGVGCVVLGVAALLVSINVIFEVVDSNENKESDKHDERKSKTDKKKSKKSGKERANDNPSWTNPDMIDKNQTAQHNAERMLNDKYGKGNWNKGPNTEYNKIIKWIQRGGYLSGIFIFNDEYTKEEFIPIFDLNG